MKNKLFRSLIVKFMLTLILFFLMLPVQLFAESKVPIKENNPEEYTQAEASIPQQDVTETENKTDPNEEAQADEQPTNHETTYTEKTAEPTKEKASKETELQELENEQPTSVTRPNDNKSQANVESISSSSEENFELTVMHMNDTHAHLDNMPNMYTAIKEIREEGSSLLLHGGDVFSGTLYFNEYKGQADLALMNLMGFDAMVYGNHEFDLGSQEGNHQSLAAFVKGANFPLLGTNVDFSKDTHMKNFVHATPAVENATGGKTYHSIVKNIDGEKVGIFGLTTEDTAAISSPMNVQFKNYLQSAKEAVKQLKDAGINKIIAVTHLGYDSNPAVGNDLNLAEVNGIDVIVGGHSHTALQQPVTVTKDNNGNDKDPTVIVQAGQYAENLGRLDVVFDEEGVLQKHHGKLIPVKEKQADRKISEALKPYSDKIESIRNEPSGAIALKDISNPRQEKPGDDSVRANETELGNLVTDAMLAKAKEKFPETVIALQNGGGIRAPIDKGEITVGEIIEILPFGNDPVVASVTGSELKEILEHSVRLAPAENGGFLHVSGMKFMYDSSKKAGNRVLNMEVKKDDTYVPINMEVKYIITTNQFTAQGGDGFDTFAKIYAAGRVKNIGEIDWQQLRDYMVNEKYLNRKVDPIREGRIIDITRNEVPESPEELKNPENPNETPTTSENPKDAKQPVKPDNKDETPDKASDDKPGVKDDNKKGGSMMVDNTINKGIGGKQLPNTATPIYTTLLIGSLLVIIGAAIFIYRRYKLKEQ
ncbi:5'-nucleotidase C-terminal domain-containing protein [Cerasibacillus sp. JNUCC 74]